MIIVKTLPYILAFTFGTQFDSRTSEYALDEGFMDMLWLVRYAPFEAMSRPFKDITKVYIDNFHDYRGVPILVIVSITDLTILTIFEWFIRANASIFFMMVNINIFCIFNYFALLRKVLFQCRGSAENNSDSDNEGSDESLKTAIKNETCNETEESESKQFFSNIFASDEKSRKSLSHMLFNNADLKTPR